MMVAAVSPFAASIANITSKNQYGKPWDAGLKNLSGRVARMNIHQLRTQICIVSQEPILFDCTIRENIVYGLADKDQVGHERIVRVCEQANVHNFILGLPDGEF